MLEINGKYTKAIVFTDMIEQEAISQIIELCNHIAFQNAKIRVMPDVHAGAGCTIGTTIETNKKIVIPNIVGVDIGCGVTTTIFSTDKDIEFKNLNDFIENHIPSGMNVRENEHRDLDLKIKTLICEIVKELGIGKPEYHINSCGTLGGGNHYIKIGKISDNTYALSVHTGSRNLGKKVCEYFQNVAVDNMSNKKNIKKAQEEVIQKLKKQGKENEINNEISKLKQTSLSLSKSVPKELSYIENEDFDRYVTNMEKCQAVANENRRLISRDILNYLEADEKEHFDTIHNYIEKVDDGNIIIRKGAVSAKKGEKLAIPLNMRDGVIIGIGKGNEEWNCSAPHGAGRLMSRSKAKESVTMEEFKDSMAGIQSWSVCRETLDESPKAYKSADSILSQVIDTIEICDVIKPVYNFKAH